MTDKRMAKLQNYRDEKETKPSARQPQVAENSKEVKKPVHRITKSQINLNNSDKKEFKNISSDPFPNPLPRAVNRTI